MEDRKIVELYWKRQEAAIRETEKKYGTFLGKIAYNILGSVEDSSECVNDTYLAAWNAMPEHRPERLSGFLAKMTRGWQSMCIEKKRLRNGVRPSIPFPWRS